MAEKDFPKLRNLAFYDGYNPEYIYFKSLLKYTSANGASPEYEAERIKVLQSVDAGKQQIMSKLYKDKNSIFNNQSAKFVECMNFLKTAIEYEQANEISYFRQKLNELKKAVGKNDKKIPEIQTIMKLLENGINIDPSGKKEVINYPEFLTAINGLLQGLDRAKTMIEYESKRLSKIDSAIQSMQDNKRRQLEGLAFKKGLSGQDAIDFIEGSMNKYENKIDTYYIKNKSFASKKDAKGKVYESLRGATTAFKGIKQEAAVELAHWINKQLESIFSNQAIVSQVVQYVHAKGIISPNYRQEIARMTKGIITQALVNEASKNMNKILDNKYRNIPKQKLLRHLEKSIDITQEYRIEGFYQNFGMIGKQLKGFKNMQEDFDLHSASSEEFMELFGRLKRSVDKAKREKYKISDERGELYEYMQNNNLYRNYDEIVQLLERLKKLKERMRTYEQRIEHNLQTKSITEEFQIGRDSQKQIVSVTLHVTPDKVYVDDFSESVKSVGAFQRLFGDSNMKLSNVKHSIANITSQASQLLRNQLADSVDNAIAQVSKEEQDELKYKLNTMIRDGLQNLQVKVNGPDLSELLAAIDFQVNDRGHIDINWSGKSKIKNDVITVTVDHDNFHFSQSFDKLLERQDERMADLIADKLSTNKIEEQLKFNVINAFQRATAKGFADNTTRTERYSKNAKLFLDSYARFADGLRNVSKEYDSFREEWDVYKDTLQARGMTDEQTQDKYKEIVSSLKDSFYISTTVKAYNQYSNKLGFGGGSIGGTLDSQLTNIADVFKLAGSPISKDDLDWLRSLIINCSPNTIAETRSEAMLEQYLGSMAAFMLFDEGGAEARILANIKTDVSVRKGTTPKIMHLYSVNGIYVPGSFVLQQTLNDLQECWKGLSSISKPTFHGASVRIVNKMNEGMIPNRGRNITNLDTNPWRTVANLASKNVSIEIFFLAGLLDTVNQMNSKLTNIQMIQ